MSQSAHTSEQSIKAPSSEALSLSASIFLNSVEEWIPKSFGTEIQSASASASGSGSGSGAGAGDNLAGLLRPTTINGHIEDRLGLGHPDAEANASNSRPMQRNGLIGLSKKLNLEKKGKSREDVNARFQLDVHDDDEDEEDSKFRSISKRKNTTIDPFGGATKKKKKDPFAVGNTNTRAAKAVLSAPLRTNGNGSAIDGEDDEVEKEIQEGSQSTEGPSSMTISRQTTPMPVISVNASNEGSGISPSPFPYDGPRPLGSPVKNQKKRPLRADEDDDGSEKNRISKDEETPDSSLNGVGNSSEASSIYKNKNKNQDKDEQSSKEKTKTQLRREKRKKAKLSKTSS
ncbi:uncharacterized protein I303_103525 [Kwoniella dejecticola CBS 10117]|uniref:Uncharacterized protein n=1 Tax=Kwoniella dejecticola CBS 10117 TaxID=1296121 RepID=A0A1A6A6Z8_9TREE|nr:uncharacterized protein I303_03549 [Kwoniella dejecticola CBS 10117]OBR85835.1 hypothetical protein I303_03549 [Kwoniella dejecticola CBS 10117]